jgi:hypothetical protein
MAKNNPLFVDSTKLRGDRIATQIELTNILLYDDEAAFILIQTPQDGILKIPLRLSEESLLEENRYEAQAWLGHQDTVSYKFTIEKFGTLLFQSAWEEVRAQYAIVTPWKPKLIDAAELPQTQPTPQAESAYDKRRPMTSVESSAHGLSSLIDKWGF